MHRQISSDINIGQKATHRDQYLFCSDTNRSDSDFEVTKQTKKLPSRTKKKEAITRIQAYAKAITSSSDEYFSPIAVKKQRKKFFLSSRPSAAPPLINPNLSPIVLSGANRELQSSPEVLRGESPKNPVLQEIQNSPTKVDEILKSKLSTNRSVKGIKCLENVLSKENVTVSPQKKATTSNLQVPQSQSYLTSKFLNSTCAAKSASIYGQPQDWNLSVISRRLTSELSEAGSSEKPNIFDEEPPQHKEIPRLTYRKVVTIRKPIKVEKDIYNFTSESDSDFVQRSRPRKLPRKLPRKANISQPEEPVVESSCDTVSSCSQTVISTTAGYNSDSMGNFKANKSLAMPSEKDVIVITDDDVEPNKKNRHSSDSSKNPVLLQYKEISIFEEDYKSLEEGEFLNDNIIDFYLTYLKEEVLAPDYRSKVYLFSTHFYGCLTKPKKFMEFEKDKNLSKPQKQYKRVERWTKNINLFEKDMVIFPICEEAHWSLIIVIKPGQINIPEDSEDRIIKGQPFIIVLDSMGGGKEKLVDKIRQYMTEEYRTKTGGTETFSKRNVRVVKPHKPEQLNFYDCGVFLLHYVEKMFGNVTKFYLPKLPDLSDWFPQAEIQVKRYQMAERIQNMASSERPGVNIKFPQIKLNKKPSKATRRSSRQYYDEEMLDLMAFSDSFDRPSRKRKDSPRKKMSLETYNKRTKRSKDSGKTKPGHGTESGDEDSQEEFGDPLLSAKQKLAQSYKIPRRGDNLTSDQILSKLETVEKQDFPEMYKDKVNAKEEKKKKEKHKTKEKASYNNKTVIDPITREKLPIGEVPDADLLDAYKVSSSNKDHKVPNNSAATCSTTDGTDFKLYLSQKESAEKGKADKEEFFNYLNKKSRKHEIVSAAENGSHSKPYNSDKYKDSRENSPNKMVKRSARHSNNGSPRVPSTPTESSQAESPQEKNNSKVMSDNGHATMKSERKEEKSMLMRRKSKSNVLQQLKTDWSDSGSEPSPSRPKRMPVPNGKKDSPDSPPFYPSLPSVPKDKATPTTHQTTKKSKSATKLTGQQQQIYSKLMSSRTKKRSLKSKAKVALNSTSASISHTTLRGNPGKLFTESTTSLSSTTSADQDKSADRSADSNPSPGRVGGQQRSARLAVTTGGNQGFRLFSARSSTSSRRSSLGDVSS